MFLNTLSFKFFLYFPLYYAAVSQTLYSNILANSIQNFKILLVIDRGPDEIYHLSLKKTWL
jgi:hypothetical protein